MYLILKKIFIHFKINRNDYVLIVLLKLIELMYL